MEVNSNFIFKKMAEHVLVFGRLEQQLNPE